MVVNWEHFKFLSTKSDWRTLLCIQREVGGHVQSLQLQKRFTLELPESHCFRARCCIPVVKKAYLSQGIPESTDRHLEARSIVSSMVAENMHKGGI